MSQSHTYQGSAPIRLNKWMAELGLCSRREAENLIRQGAIHVDDQLIDQPGHKIETGQTLHLSAEAKEQLLSRFTAVLNKPVDYVSAQAEPGQIPAVRLLRQKNAADAMPGPHPDHSLAPLGRLDQDSRGLLLLSDDGVLAKAIIGPDHTLEKEYIVTVQGKITEGRLTLLRNGLKLDERPLKPAKIMHQGEQTLRFILKEGRKRQIRRMCQLVGLHVTDLLRIRIGPLVLGDLPEGQWRKLTEAERQALISASAPPSPRRRVAPQDRRRAPAKARRAPRRPETSPSNPPQRPQRPEADKDRGKAVRHDRTSERQTADRKASGPFAKKQAGPYAPEKKYAPRKPDQNKSKRHQKPSDQRSGRSEANHPDKKQKSGSFSSRDKRTFRRSGAGKSAPNAASRRPRPAHKN